MDVEYIRYRTPLDRDALCVSIREHCDFLWETYTDAACRRNRVSWEAYAGITGFSDPEGVREDVDRLYGDTDVRHIYPSFFGLLALYQTGGTELYFQRQGIIRLQTAFPKQGSWHRHSYIELAYVVRGHFSQVLLGEPLRVPEGSLLITDQNCTHADLIDNTDAAVLFLSVDPGLLRGILQEEDSDNPLLAFLWSALDERRRAQSFLLLTPEDGAGEIPHLLEELFHLTLIDGNKKTFRLLTEGFLRLLFEQLALHYTLQMTSSGEEGDRQLLYEIERMIRMDPASACAASLEAKFHYHRNHYTRLLKKYRGMTLQTYITAVRLELACGLLQRTELPIRKIAGQVGYENSSHFYHLFERQYGCSPAEWRAATHADHSVQCGKVTP